MRGRLALSRVRVTPGRWGVLVDRRGIEMIRLRRMSLIRMLDLVLGLLSPSLPPQWEVEAGKTGTYPRGRAVPHPARACTVITQATVPARVDIGI